MAKRVTVGVLFAVLLVVPSLHSQQPMAAIRFTMPDFGALNVGERTIAIREQAVQIRTFTGCAEKAVLASELLNVSDDMPDDVLQEIATTYAAALNGCRGEYDNAYFELAWLIRHTQMRVPADDPRLAAALDKVDAQDREIQAGDFRLPDMRGKQWTLKELRGKVVLLNFWMIGCPPCVHEIPALDALDRRFRAKGLVILAITGDDAARLRGFLREHRTSYPVLLDSERKVTERFHAEAYPRSMVFDREGKLTTQVIGSRTEEQFVRLIGQAGFR